MNVLIAGEGPTELGGWYKEQQWRDETPEPGVIEALLRRVGVDGWRIVEGIHWKRIRKYKAGEHRAAEERNVLGLCLIASESGIPLVVFVRDRDGDKARQASVNQGIESAAKSFPAIRIAGGVACEQVEAWLLALSEQRGAESHRDSKQAFLKLHGDQTTTFKVDLIERASLARIPDDATSLLSWLQRVEQALSILDHSTS